MATAVAIPPQAWALLVLRPWLQALAALEALAALVAPVQGPAPAARTSGGAAARHRNPPRRRRHPRMEAGAPQWLRSRRFSRFGGYMLIHS